MIKVSSIIVVSTLVLASCSSPSNNENVTATDSMAVDSSALMVEAPYIMPSVQEDYNAGVHMSKKHHELKKAGLPTDSVDTLDNYETVTVDVFVAALADSDIVPVAPAPAAAPDSITVTTAATVLNTDQTVVELGKRGQASSIEVISSKKDPNVIDKIVYTDKNHVDVYNVKAGMTAHDVRKLRREMKHMVKDGKVFMYEDDSNIMYQMTATDQTTKTSYTDDEVDNMTVDAIVWQNNGAPKAKKSK